jgi:hypothetical protein
MNSIQHKSAEKLEFRELINNIEALKAKVVHKNYCYFVMLICAAFQTQGPRWLPDLPCSTGK